MNIKNDIIGKKKEKTIFTIMNNEIRKEKIFEDESTFSETNSINKIEENYFPEKCSKLKESNNSLFQMEKQKEYIKNISNKIYISSYFFLKENFDNEINKKISSIDFQIFKKEIENNNTFSDNSKIDKNLYNEKPIYRIPIYKIENEINNKNKNYIKNNEILDVENLKKGLNTSINNLLCNGLFINKKNYINTINKLFVSSNNINNMIYNSFNINLYNQFLFKILAQKKIFIEYKEIGLSTLMNPNNINHYLFNLYINKNVNNINYNTKYNNTKKFIPDNNEINYIFPYFLNPNNFIAQNCFLKKDINNTKNISNINKSRNIINPNKFLIEFNSKGNNPNIDKILKLQIATSYVNDIPKCKQSNVTSKKEKKIINLKDIESGKETRTVVRLNPIPPNFSCFDISKLLDKYLKIKSGKNKRIYKALYTPLCRIIGQNLGYCFVMMVKPKYVIEFYKTFYGRIFGKKKCRKPCNVIWADKQGDDFLNATEDDPIRKPIIFKDIKED